ncbi:MAG: hypothetical protein HQL90_14360 [Magnetococcales bacterium]|nr:hypothetical protein [Magnetococcales bacterium]
MSKKTAVKPNKKQKKRLANAEKTGHPELYQWQHQVSGHPYYGDARSFLWELRSLAIDRKAQGRGIMADELVPFLNGIGAVIEAASIRMGETRRFLEKATDPLKLWTDGNASLRFKSAFSSLSEELSRKIFPRT